MPSKKEAISALNNIREMIMDLFQAIYDQSEPNRRWVDKEIGPFRENIKKLNDFIRSQQ